MAFSSVNLPKINFGKLLEGLGLGKPRPSAGRPWPALGACREDFSDRLLIACRKKPSMAFSSVNLPKINFGKLLEGLGLGKPRPSAGRPWPALGACREDFSDRLLIACRKKPSMAFSSVNLPKVNFGKLLKGLGLGKPRPLAGRPWPALGACREDFSDRLLIACRKKPSMAFSSVNLPKVNFGKLLKGLGLGKPRPLAGRPWPAPGACRKKPSMARDRLLVRPLVHTWQARGLASRPGRGIFPGRAPWGFVILSRKIGQLFYPREHGSIYVRNNWIYGSPGRGGSDHGGPESPGIPGI